MKIRKILLISPSYSEPGLISRFLRFKPRALEYLPSLAPEYNYEIVDENIEKLNPKHLKDVDLVGITTMTVSALRAYQIADEIRAMGIPVVMGGSHVTFLPEEAIKHADSVVIGEAEGVWPKLLKDFENGRQKKFYKNEELVKLSGLPLTGQRQLSKKYKYFFDKTIQLTRGCPFNCSFCSVTHFFGRKYRHRPIPEATKGIKEIIEEDETSKLKRVLGSLWKEVRKPVFVFLDDNIYGQQNYTKELCKALIPLKILWGSQCSVNAAQDKETVKLMAESGARVLFVGFESINPSVLDEIGKRQNKIGFYKQAMKIFHRNGITVMAAFVFGFDHDTNSSFEETVKFAKAINSDFAQFTILTPLSGTSLREKLEKEGRITSNDWSKYNFEEVVFEPKKMSADELSKGSERSWKEFYSLWSILERSPLFQKEWWEVFWKSPGIALLRFFIYLFGNLGYRRQRRNTLKYRKRNQKK